MSEFRILLLSGPPASGKDTISRVLEASDPRFRFFPRLKCGSGRMEGYRAIEARDLAELRASGQILQEHERYGNRYAVDLRLLTDMLADGLVPIIHVGRRNNLTALRSAAPCLAVFLWADRATTEARLAARRDLTPADRLEAWEQEKSDALSAPPGWWDLALSTSELSPQEVAAEIADVFSGRKQPNHLPPASVMALCE